MAAIADVTEFPFDEREALDSIASFKRVELSRSRSEMRRNCMQGGGCVCDGERRA